MIGIARYNLSYGDYIWIKHKSQMYLLQLVDPLPSLPERDERVGICSNRCLLQI